MPKSRALKETLNSLTQMGDNPFHPVSSMPTPSMVNMAKQVHQDAKRNLNDAQESMMRAKIHIAGAKLMMKPGQSKPKIKGK